MRWLLLALAVVGLFLDVRSADICNPKNWIKGYTYKNRQYDHVNATTVADCCAKCKAYTGFNCTYFTFTAAGGDAGVCWLKTNNGGLRKDQPTTTSGTPYPTPPTPPPTPRPPPPTPPPSPGPPPTPPPTPWDNKPAKVFILLGQSNMLGEGKIYGETQNGTLEFAVKKENKYPYVWDAAAKTWAVNMRVRNVFVMGSGGATSKVTVQHNEMMTVPGHTGNHKTIGPEFGISHFGGNLTQDHVMLLKSCIGNRALGWDLLPPGSKSYEYTDKNNVTWVYAAYHQSPMKWKKGTTPVPGTWIAGEQWDGDIYRADQVLADLKTYYPGVQKYEIAGFFWWQGDKDSRDMGLSTRYEFNLVNFIKALRAHYKVPNAPFVTASLGQTVKGDHTSGGGKILDAMLAVDGTSGKYPEFKGNVAAVYSHPLSMGSASGSHYGGNAETYMNIGQAMGAAMSFLLKGGN